MLSSGSTDVSSLSSTVSHIDGDGGRHFRRTRSSSSWKAGGSWQRRAVTGCAGRRGRSHAAGMNLTRLQHAVRVAHE